MQSIRLWIMTIMMMKVKKDNEFQLYFESMIGYFQTEWPPDVTGSPSWKPRTSIFHWWCSKLLASNNEENGTEVLVSCQIKNGPFFTTFGFFPYNLYPFFCQFLFSFRLPLSPLPSCINVIFQIVLLLLYNSRLLSFSNGIIFWRDTIFLFLQLFYGLLLFSSTASASATTTTTTTTPAALCCGLPFPNDDFGLTPPRWHSNGKPISIESCMNFFSQLKCLASLYNMSIK